MQVLNKYDKEQLVIRLHQEGKTIREVCDLQQEFWALHQLDDLPLVYQELK